MRGPGLHLILLPLLAWAASTALQTDAIKSTIVTGKNSFQCKFAIVLLPSNKVNLKKSKVVCNPRKPKRQKASNVNLVGKLATYLVSLTINPTKIKQVEVQEEPSTTKTTTSDKTTSTIDPGSGTESGTCHVGFTSICEVDKTNGCPPDMYKVCPNKEHNEKENEQSTGCSCLPTLLVQQAVQAGISPLGCGRGCVCVEGDMEQCGLTTRDPIEMPSKSSVVPTLAEEKKLIYFGPGTYMYQSGRNLVLTYPDLKLSNCSVALHPRSDFQGYVGTMTKWGTLVCGGFWDSEITRGKSCYTYRHGVWKPSNQMFTPRNMAAAAWISTPLGTMLWWVTGGSDGVHTASTSSELYDPNTQRWSYGVVMLPVQMSGHCMVAINTTHVFIVGGRTWGSSCNGIGMVLVCTGAYMYSMESGFLELPGSTLDLIDWQDQFSCEVLGHNVWVLGKGNQLQYFNLTSLTWGDGPTLHRKNSFWPGLLTSVDENLICLVGNGIYKMVNGVWTLVDEIKEMGPSSSMAIIWDYEDCVDTGSSTTSEGGTAATSALDWIGF